MKSNFVKRNYHRFRINVIVLNLKLLFISALLFPSFSHSKETLPRIKDRWVKSEIAGSKIYCQGDQKTATQALAYFEYLRQSVFIMTGQRAVKAPTINHVFLFKEKSFENYKPKSEDRQGFLLQFPEGNYMALSGSERSFSDVAQTYLQYLLRSHFGNLPLWFESGFAAYLSSFKVSSKEVTIGLPVSDYLSNLRYDDGMPYAQLLRLSAEELPTLSKKQAKLWPAQSWLLVHYLFHGEKGRMRLQMDEFLKNAIGGENSEEVLRSAFGLDVQQLQANLKDYVRQPQQNFLTIALTELNRVDGMQAAPLAEEEILCHLGDLLAHMGDAQSQKAEAYFKSSLAIRPQFAPSYSGLGFIAAQRQEKEAAVEYFSKAIELGIHDAQTYYRLGAVFLDTTGSVGRTAISERILRARGYLQRAIDLDEDFIESYALYGKTFLYDLPGSPHSGVVALEQALARMPGREDIAIDLFCIYALQGDTLRANYLHDEIIAKRWNKTVLLQAEPQMVRAAMSQGEKWLEEEKYDKVIPLLGYARRFADVSALPRLAEMLTTAKTKRQKELYQLAVARAGSDEAAAVEYLQQAMALAADVKITASCQALYHQVGKRLQLALYSDAMMRMNENKLKQAESLLQRAIALNANPEITSRAKKLLKNVRAAM